MDFSFPPGAHGTGTYNTIGTGTGWSAMARIVREIDEQKIQNYKDDIDTILVFAGLFSAVMTAFLVESYHNLSQDPTQVMVLLMRQLTMQTHSYAMNGGFLNSTAPPLPDIPEFTPTTNAIRVNVLWFASLTLSLMSASFSILVKQWLQEYLSGEFTSPQARIRIRHFRYPGLDDWKVFEIAAALPLVLQLSLALFFVGLCFFTADVHSTVGHTTLPLVGAWAFLFLVVSLAPALSPRCPYKTRLLKSPMQALRKEILRIIMWVKDVSLKDITPLPEISSKWSYQLLAYNEADAAGTDAKDVDIFISVDSIQTDELLLRAMWDALHQTTPQFHEEYVFIAKAVEHRSSGGHAIPAVSDSDVGQKLDGLDLKSIPKQMVPFILTITSEILKKELERQLSSIVSESSIDWSPALKGCLYLLLSETNADIPDAVEQLFLFLFDNQLRFRALFKALTSLAMPPDSFLRVLARLQPAITRANRDNLLDILASLMRSFFCSSPDHSHIALIDVVKDHLDSNSSQHVSAMVKLVISLTKNAIVLSTEKSHPSWTAGANVFLFQLYGLDAAASDQCRDDIVEFVRFFLVDWKNLLITFAPMFSMHNRGYELIEESARWASIQAAVSSNPSELAEILDNFRKSASVHANKDVFEEDESTPGHWHCIDPLHASLVFLRLLKALRENGTSLEEHAHVIRGFFIAIEEGLETLASMHKLWKEDYRTSAKGCLELVKELDVPRPPEYWDHDAFVEWAIDVSADDSNSLFPDIFLWNVALYLPEEESDLCSPRIRRMWLLQFKSSSSATAAEETTASLLKLLQSRSQQEDIDSFLDLRSLPEETVTVAMAMATAMLKKEINRQSTPDPKIAIDWSPWMEDCVYILLSLTAHPMPGVADELLSSLLGPVFVSRIQGFFKALTARVPVTSADGFSHVIQRLHGTLSILEGGYLLGHLELLMQHYFCPPGANHERETLIDIIRDHQEIPPQHVSAMVRMLISLVKNAMISPEESYPSWGEYAVGFLFQLYGLDAATPDQCRADIVEFVRFFLLRWKYVSTIFNPMFSMYGTRYELIRESAREAVIQAAVTSSPSELAEILDNFRDSASVDANSSVFSEDEGIHGHWNRIDPLHASLVFLRLLKALRENGTSLEEHKDVIRRFFTAIEEGLEAVADMHQLWKVDYRASAIRCLELVSELDVCKPPADEDPEAFDERTQKPSMPEISDSFIEKIALYLPGPQEEFLVSHRIRRLLLPRTVSGDKPIAEATVIPSEILHFGLRRPESVSQEFSGRLSAIWSGRA